MSETADPIDAVEPLPDDPSPADAPSILVGDWHSAPLYTCAACGWNHLTLAKVHDHLRDAHGLLTPAAAPPPAVADPAGALTLPASQPSAADEDVLPDALPDEEEPA
jgi:hypothetical protein